VDWWAVTFAAEDLAVAGSAAIAHHLVLAGDVAEFPFGPVLDQCSAGVRPQPCLDGGGGQSLRGLRRHGAETIPTGGDALQDVVDHALHPLRGGLATEPVGHRSAVHLGLAHQSPGGVLKNREKPVGGWLFVHRGDRIRTCGLLLPKQLLPAVCDLIFFPEVPSWLCSPLYCC